MLHSEWNSSRILWKAITDCLERPRESKVLVITGDHEFIPAATAEHIAQAIPSARLVTLKDCGHFSYLEAPVAVRQQIDALFRGKMKAAGPR
jgi:pimeloyl-ACP methyl ester carboxylesterase